MLYLFLSQINNLLIWSIALILFNVWVINYKKQHLSGLLQILIKKKSTRLLAFFLVKISILFVIIRKQNKTNTIVMYMHLVRYYTLLKNWYVVVDKRVNLSTLVKLGLHKRIKFDLPVSKAKISNTVQSNLILHKPLHNIIDLSQIVSKLFIRKSRVFTKTKYSSIRQECKGIVHTVLILNTIFIFFVFNACMHWYFTPELPLVVLTFIAVYSMPVVFKVKQLKDFYKNLFNSFSIKS